MNAELLAGGRATMPTLRYRAFLSYSHRDAAWAKWLHRALETYRIDKDLIGRATRYGAIPETLRPIFRDREDFSAGDSLTDQTRAALAASQFLVAICSPHAARSDYVNEEVRLFKAMGGVDRVIPIIVDGRPGDAQRECFPPALRFKLDADGQLSDEHADPIAADARPEGDGKQIALQKLVAGLLGVGLDEIMRRANRARKRRNRMFVGLAGLGVALAVGAVGGWTGAMLLQSKLSSAQILDSERDAADLCEKAAATAALEHVPDARRTAFALHCLETLVEGLEGLPDDVDIPQQLIRSLEANLVLARELRGVEPFTSSQLGTLRRAAALVDRAHDR